MKDPKKQQKAYQPLRKSLAMHSSHEKPSREWSHLQLALRNKWARGSTTT